MQYIAFRYSSVAVIEMMILARSREYIVLAVAFLIISFLLYTGYVQKGQLYFLL